MGFTRSAILKPEVEEHLKIQLRDLWTNGLSAREISEALEFGVPKTEYVKLKKYHVWYYRQKFNNDKEDKRVFGKFPKRGKGGTKKGQSRYKSKPDETMSFQKFQARINKVLPKVEYSEDWLTQHICKKRAYLILHYWSPLRKSEILERVGVDFNPKGEFLIINLYRKKKYYRPRAETEPFNLLLKLPMVDEVVDWVTRFEEDEKPFNFSGVTAWQYVKDVFPDGFPHFFRFNFITKAVENTDDPGKLITKLLEDTGLDIQTVMAYIMANPRHKGSIARRELEILKAQGIIT